mgnify:CR=1 FL=1
MSSPFKYFTYEEFDSPDEKGSGKRMKAETIRRFDIARECASKEKGKDLPFIVEKGGGYRTESYNKKAGGVKGSAHTRGYAADFNYETKKDKEIMLKCLIKAGFNRFGIREGASGTSIHVDNDPNKPQYAYWGYNDEKGNYVEPSSPWTLT